MKWLFFASMLVACARDEVEVAELASTDAAIDQAVPDFAHDAAVDAPTCGAPPPLDSCEKCPHGYRVDADDGPTCDCCP